jgi:ParB family transcriptional regulator, chromosome partitioning protein
VRDRCAHWAGEKIMQKFFDPMRLIVILLTVCDIAFNPRSTRDPAYIGSLSENIKANGQKVPIIGFFLGDRFQVADGGCRVEALRLAGATEVLALDLGEEPTKAELLMAQASIDFHKQHLPPIDRAKLYQATIEACSCPVSHLAKELGISGSLIGRYLELLHLPVELQHQVNVGELDFSKGVVVAQESDPTRQQELALLAKTLSRDALCMVARKGRSAPTATINDMSTPLSERVKKIRVPMPSGTVQISGEDLDLESAIAAALEFAKRGKRAVEANWDIKTFVGACKSEAEAGTA